MSLVLIVFNPFSSSGQRNDTRGSIAGQITNDDGPVFGALVEVLQQGVKKGGCVTDENGDYVVKSLAPGRYDIRVYSTGTRSAIVKDMIVSVTDTNKVNCHSRITNPEDVGNSCEIFSEWTCQITASSK